MGIFIVGLLFIIALYFSYHTFKHTVRFYRISKYTNMVEECVGCGIGFILSFGASCLLLAILITYPALI